MLVNSCNDLPSLHPELLRVSGFYITVESNDPFPTPDSSQHKHFVRSLALCRFIFAQGFIVSRHRSAKTLGFCKLPRLSSFQALGLKLKNAVPLLAQQYAATELKQCNLPSLLSSSNLHSYFNLEI